MNGFREGKKRAFIRLYIHHKDQKENSVAKHVKLTLLLILILRLVPIHIQAKGIKWV